MRSMAQKTLLLSITTLLFLGVSGFVTNSSASLRFEAVYSQEPVDVRVWLEKGYGDSYCGEDDGYGDVDVEDAYRYYDVYPTVNDVVLYVRAARSCYTTVYVIDTEGFIHVVYPFSPFDDAYLIGGRVYRLSMSDYGFDASWFGRGVAFAFAVTSPIPFRYASYGVSVFGPHVGFQVFGDPFVAARLFWISVVPPACRSGFIGVSYARFYVGHYVRYPSYLCLGWHEHYGANTYCGGQCAAHRQYRIHARDPYRALRPTGGFDTESARYTEIRGTGAKNYTDERRRASSEEIERSRGITRDKGPGVEKRVRASQNATVQSDPVVRSTKDVFVASKRNYAKMREAFEKSGATDRPGPARTPAQAKTRKVTERASNEDARKVAARSGSVPAREKSDAGNDRKRARM